MSNALQDQKNHDVLRHLIPLNTLSNAQFNDLCLGVEIEDCDKDTVLFEQGDIANEFIYLISGMVNFYDADVKTDTIVTGSQVARFALAHQTPRKLKAVVMSKARIARIHKNQLDFEKPKNFSQPNIQEGAVEDRGEDWMSTMLRSPVFQHLSASNLQKVMRHMEEVEFNPGELIVSQGEDVAYYYIIKSGDCVLIHKPAGSKRSFKLADELHVCDTFGEEALLSGMPGNLTIRMKERGEVLRLAKSHFFALVKEPVMEYANFKCAKEKVSEGANWLDVRSLAEYDESHIKASVNIPLFSLRTKISQLKQSQLQILVCENGKASEAAAFVLLQFGFDAIVLEGGMRDVRKSDIVSIAGEALEHDEFPVAEVLTKEKSARSNEGCTKEKELIKESQSKLVEFEKLKLESELQLNTLLSEHQSLELELNEQTQLVSELQVLSKTQEKQLVTTHTNGEEAHAQLNKVLTEEKKQNTILATELKSSQDELSKAVNELDSSQKTFAELQQDIARIKQTFESERNELEKELNLQSELMAELKALSKSQEEQLVAKQTTGEENQAQLNETLAGEKKHNALLLTEIKSKQNLLDTLASEKENVQHSLDESQKEMVRLKQVFESESKNVEKELNQQIGLVSELKALSKSQEEQLVEKQTSGIDAKTQLNKALSDEKKHSAALVDELKNKQDSMDKMSCELQDTQKLFEKEQDKLVSLEKSIAKNEGSIAAQKDELKSLKAQLTAAEKNELALSQEFEKKLTQAHQQQSDLDKKSSLLEKEVEETKRVFEELSTNKANVDQELEELKLTYAESQSTMSEMKSRFEEVDNALNKLSSEREKENKTNTNQQVTMEDRLLSSESEKTILEKSVRQLKESLSATSNSAEKAAVELEGFKQEQLTVKDLVKGLQETVKQQEKSIQSLELEKEKMLASANKAMKQTTKQFEAKVLAAQKEIKQLLCEVNGRVEEKVELQDEMIESDAEKVELKKTIDDLRHKASQSTAFRINELEKQLDDAMSAQLDLEIKLESSSAINAEINMDEIDELRAAKSELDLVREQTAKDVKAMETKVENSERMNLSLKKKILSMQTLNDSENSQATPEDLSHDKKKSWWKK
ncbi:MAG: hypothetical protein COB22_02895 [Cycloclasticus sp.]|nr:MAG: hypothetical protein COB22_02895 [Cycloclasticus sp.]